MSCVAALIDGGSVYVGSDSLVCDGQSVWYTKYPKWKVSKSGRVLVACVGNERMSQLVRNIEFLDDAPIIDEVFNWARTVKSMLPENDKLFEGMVVGNGKIFTFSNDYAVIEEVNKFQAIGSGRDLAIGALFSLRETAIDPMDKIRISLEAAREYTTTVGGKIHTTII